VIAEGTATELKSRIDSTHVEVTVGLGDEAGPCRARRIGARPPTPPAASRSGARWCDVLAAVRALAPPPSVSSLASRRPTLDDVFLELTGHAAVDGEEPETAPRSLRWADDRDDRNRDGATKA
jgi:ABC-2 type transport system ATP-binding protein